MLFSDSDYLSRKNNFHVVYVSSESAKEFRKLPARSIFGNRKMFRRRRIPKHFLHDIMRIVRRWIILVVKTCEIERIEKCLKMVLM